MTVTCMRMCMRLCVEVDKNAGAASVTAVWVHTHGRSLRECPHKWHE